MDLPTGAIIRALPWSALWELITLFFQSRVSVIGAESSGKTTFRDVIYNNGTLIEIRDYRRTNTFRAGGHRTILFPGPLGIDQFRIRSLIDTPGQSDVASDLVRHLIDYRPRFLVLLIDASRPFHEPPERAVSDTSKWFDAVLSAAQKQNINRFSHFANGVLGVAVLLNKFNRVHEDLLSRGVTDTLALTSELKKRENDLMSSVEPRLKRLFELGGRALAGGDFKVIRTCLVRYDGKAVNDYDNALMQTLEYLKERFNLTSR